MTLTILDNIEQRSEEWQAARRGIVTASVVGKLLSVGSPGAMSYGCPVCQSAPGDPCISKTRKEPTPIKTVHDVRTAVALEQAADAPPVIELADNDTSRGLVATLAAERVSGFTEDIPITRDMWRGLICEPIARDLYSAHYQQAVEVGFMRRDEDRWTLGYSPDGLVADDGLVEIKSPRAKTHLNTILADEVPVAHMPQLQAGLLVSRRKWCDFVSYVGGMPLFVKRVFPEPLWFDAITAAVVAFEGTVAQIVDTYTKATAGMPKTERIDFDPEVI